ncbi:GAF domain-containing protein [Streptomyces rimosus]|uniref:GAF domain-containing protein n=1 Tax=Streptomyces rimosus TaxID=1927 RepID=UPI00067CA7D3|nr:GAF domain-containing protein [Streptomyces rimosus]
MSNPTVTDLAGQLQPGGPGPSDAWCRQCTRLLGVDGTAITVFFDAPQLMWHSDPHAARLDDLQYVLGEGPVFDAARGGSRCVIADLSRPGNTRWLVFTSQALQLGMRAVWAFPLQHGNLRIGALACHRRTAGELSPSSTAGALLLADALATALLGDRRTQLRLLSCELPRAEVHQAAGILSERLRVPAPAALARLRAHAFATGRPVSLVAHDIVAGHLSLPCEFC